LPITINEDTGMNKLLLVTAILSGFCLSACSEPTPAPEAPAQPAVEQPAAISSENQGVLTDRQRETYNAANQVSNLLNDADAERRRQLEAQEK
jgi:hypothetical protein